MSGDIVDQLRYVSWLAEEGSEVTDLAATAADEIQRLRARVTELEAENERIEGQRKLRADIAYVMVHERNDERALSDQLAEALRERESSHYSWCPANDSDEIAKSVWPDGCPFCAALAAYDAARKEPQ
jgi:vacuolar-type H+-ATPase subunit I/STV1